MSQVTDVDPTVKDLWFASRIGRTRYGLLLLGVVCQLVTIWMTWPLWQTRTAPPHLPTFDLPQFSFGWLVIASLVLVCALPRWGLPIHWCVLIVASIFDQFRLQPQFFSIAVLMTACVWESGRIAARWILASTWLWAGLHKLASPDWFGHSSHWLLERTDLDADATYIALAWIVAIIELAVGVLACVRPRWAAPACAVMHTGIALTISPLLLNWNESVLPWNLAAAVIGAWVMWKTVGWLPTRRWETAFGFAWLFAPFGFYVGWIDHGFSGVLYSDSIPEGLITTTDGVHPIRGWGELAVPFPNERRTLRIYFEQYGDPGDKLHISDPRPLLADAFYVLGADGHARPIDIDSFFAGQPVGSGDDDADRDNRDPIVSEEIGGVGLDARRATFALRQAGVRMVRQASDQPIYAVAFTPENFDRDLLVYLEGLPNLMQIQLAGTAIKDDDLRRLGNLRLLTGVGLDQTGITDAGLAHLRELPYLQYVECEGTKITPQGLESVLKGSPAFVE